ncbi:MAG: cbb3-type cytochrome c oxidase subunit 3 [Rudaea sp.]|nr:cbb3-type cytochrome c oxidase subunit 3 [Rudaea sp.]
MIMGIITALLIVLFLGIVAWAYSARRSTDFEAAASLPLTDDQPGPAR